MFDQKTGAGSNSGPQDIFAGVEPPANLPVANTPKPASPTPGGPTPGPSGAPRPTPTGMPTSSSAPRPSLNQPNQPLGQPAASPGSRPAPTIIRPPVDGDSGGGKIISDRHLGTGGHVWKTALVVILAFIAMGATAFIIYKVMQSPGAAEGLPSTSQGDRDENQEPTDGKGGTDETEPEPEPQEPIILDTDGDGLTNDAERLAGTNIAKPDTDSDLLGDKEEVEVYGTDPLREDTDGDTFKDGEEVAAGYNPNGPGKLLEIPNSE